MSNYYILTNLLSDDERRVITSIVRHIELGGNKVGIQQIASENYVSTAFIMKLCKPDRIAVQKQKRRSKGREAQTGQPAPRSRERIGAQRGCRRKRRGEHRENAHDPPSLPPKNRGGLLPAPGELFWSLIS